MHCLLCRFSHVLQSNVSASSSGQGWGGVSGVGRVQSCRASSGDRLREFIWGLLLCTAAWHPRLLFICFITHTHTHTHTQELKFQLIYLKAVASLSSAVQLLIFVVISPCCCPFSSSLVYWYFFFNPLLPF